MEVKNLLITESYNMEDSEKSPNCHELVKLWGAPFVETLAE